MEALMMRTEGIRETTWFLLSVLCEKLKVPEITKPGDCRLIDVGKGKY